MLIFARLKEREMNLFEIKADQVTFAPQALLLKPFKEIWDCDVTKDKSSAPRELAYVYYMADDRSDFQYMLDDEERHEAVVQFVMLPDGWQTPDYIDKALEFYRKYSETTSTYMLRSTRGIVKKLAHFLDTVDPNERDKSNKLVFTTSQIISSVEKMPKLIRALSEIEQEVIKEKDIKNQSGNRNVGVNDDRGI
jgi:hypothetical protein